MSEAPTTTWSQDQQDRAVALLAAMPDAVVHVDGDGVVRFASQATEPLLGWPPDAMQGRSLAALIHPEDARPLLHRHASGGTRTGRARWQRGDGTWCWMEDRVAPHPSGGSVTLLRPADDQVAAEQQLLGVQADLAMMAARFSAMLDGLPVPAIARNLDGQITYANRCAADFYGYDAPTDMLGRAATAYIHPDDRERLLAAMAADEVPRQLELRQLRRDGTTRIASGHSIDVELDGEQAYLIVLHDVTELREAEAAVQRSERLLLQVLESVGEGVLLVDEDSRIQLANPAASRLMELPVEALIGKRVVDSQTFTDADGMLFTAASTPSAVVLRTGEPVGPIDVAMRDGAVWLSLIAMPLREGDDDRPTKVVVSARDVTRERQARAELAASEQRHRTLVQTLHEGLIVHDRDGVVLSANPAAVRLLGIPLEELVGSSYLDDRLRHIDLNGNPLDRLDHPALLAARTGRPVRDTILGVPRPGQEPRWLRVNAQPIDDRSGCVYTVFEDMTEYMTAQRALAESEAHFRLLTEGSSDLIARIGTDGRFLYLSPSVMPLLGRSADDLTGEACRDLVHPDDLDVLPGVVGELYSGHPRRRGRGELRLRHAHGHYRWFEVLWRPHVERDGRLTEIHAVARDIQERKDAMAALARSEQQFRSLSERAPMGIYLADPDGVASYVNPWLAQLVGRQAAELLGHGWVGTIHPGDLAAVQAGWATAAARQESRNQFRVVTDTGDVRHVLNAITRVEAVDGTPRYLGTIVDVTVQHELAEQHRFDATHDALTGLANRTLLLERLDAAVASPDTTARPSVLFIDLDRFKAVNGTHGHAFGDEVLREVGARLQRSVRASDLAARLGGDEFVVLCEGPQDADEVERMARRIIATLDEPIVFAGGGTTRVGASIGIAVAEPGVSPDIVLHRADDAAYGAKRSGGSAIAHHTPHAFPRTPVG